MSFAVIDLADGGTSLEMRPGDVATLRQRLADMFGPVEVVAKAAHDEVFVSGERFLFTNEWDDPALIATSSAGAAMLRKLAGSAHPLAAE